ncbi:hypothetical protein HHL21_12290 [Massilia sp. RP-1-19]|uniref:Uncharacterized protein n=1 Tax=Massilia polaris TaxID=2728846 RepID=A0A848HNV1_9BURK|nr:hypothetical protein [Massilia polaris]NML61840.1 hypothetical protein [Massilia polaris]
MTITQVITALPAVPDPATDTPATFSAKAAASVLAQKAMTPELNTWATQANALAVEVGADADAAADQAALAVSSAAAAVSASTAALWVTGTTYALGVTVIAPSNMQGYRKKTASSVSSIDPASDATNWTIVGMYGVKGANIASAATVNLSTATGDYIHITGTTTITTITIPIGAERTVIFDGALTLTHGAALLLPGAANIVTAANDRMIVRGDTTGAIVTSYTKSTGAATAGTPYLHVREEQASGTNGGTSVAADITQTRVLNTVKTNTIGASLASNTITLLAGTYQCRIRVPSYSTNTTKAFLYNSSDASYIFVGSNSYPAASGACCDSFIVGQFTLATTKNLTVRHWTGAAFTNGLGVATSISGQIEVYTEAEFWKVA